MEPNILDRIDARLRDTDEAVLTAAREELTRQDIIIRRRGKLLQDIFNCEAGEMLPLEIKNRIQSEMGY